MKRSVARVLAVIGVGAVLALAAMGTKRVPANHQGVRISKSGEVSHYGPGRRFVWPFSGRFIVYPSGVVERRFPPEGVYEARTGAGERAGVAVKLGIEIPEDSGEFIYYAFGKDIWGGLSDLVKETVEIEAARRPTEKAALEDFADAIVEQIKPALRKAGIRVVSRRIDAFEAMTGREGTAATPAGSRRLRKTILIGVDGGDWTIIRPMMEDGQLPNFKRIVEEGSTGPLRSIEPLLSPLIWTSIATGKLPEHHGILNFTVVDPKTGDKTPISRMSRKVDALWNLLGDYGRTVVVVGWLASHPAEDVNGVVVTDRVGYLAYADAADDETLAPGSVSPASRADEIAGLVVRSRDVGYEDFRRLLDIDRETFEKEKLAPFAPDNLVNNLIMLYSSVRTYHGIAKHLLGRDRPDFAGIYFEWCDAVGHLFMSFAPPRLEWVDERDYEKFKDVMRQTYIIQDRIIGEFIGMSDDDTVILIVSDHGFKSGGLRPRLAGEIAGGHAAFWHRPFGIIGLWGSGVRRGYTIEGASVLDIAPTVLALQGLPQAADMPGRVLIDAFEDSLGGRFDRTVVATLERRRGEGSLDVSPGAGDEEALKKLEALGYITRENPDAHNNLGQRYQAQGEYDKAIEQFKKALAINPNFPSALNNIGVCYGKTGEYPLAEQAFQKALSLKKDDVYAMNNLAIMYMETGRLDKAREYGEMAVRTEPSYANGHLTLGSVHATLGNFDRAEQEFARALELDPTSRSARTNLEKVRLEKSRGAPPTPGGNR